jgi:hypothetical protein
MANQLSGLTSSVVEYVIINIEEDKDSIAYYAV